MKLSLSDEQMMGVLQPYLTRTLAADNAEAKTVLRGGRRSVLVRSARNLRARWLRNEKVRDSAEVQQFYTDSYAQGATPVDAIFAQERGNKPYRFGGDRLVFMSTAGFFTAYLAALETAVAALRPASVCEIGFGSGKNLFYLAPRFPDIVFSGYELTQSGVDIAVGLQQSGLPSNLAKWIGHSDAAATENLRRIKFLQGNATALPAPDKSVDMTVTVLALEQMADILPQALSEIRRITRRYVAFLEPFHDANDMFGLLHLWSSNYFHARQSEIAAAGFRPLALVTNLPNKITFSAAMLIAEVA